MPVGRYPEERCKKSIIITWNKIMEEERTILLDIEGAIAELFNIWQFEKSKHWLNRRWLVRPINKKRLSHGHFNTIFQEIKSDPDMFFAYTRMDLETFNFLLSLIEPHIKIFKIRRDGILAEQRLAITLRYLSTGDDILSIALDYRMGYSTVYKIIKETCCIIYEVLSPIYSRPPCKPAWRNIAKGFFKDWNMPNCIGAVDGKHIAIKVPSKSGSLYLNYKKFKSIVLLATCNHRYEFTVVDVGAYDGESDGGIFARSEFGKALDEGSLNIPNEFQNLPGTDIKMPYFFIGDEAFKMSKNLMRPYPGQHLSNEKRIFNYRLSRARRCIESAFGILVARWRVFTKPIGFEPSIVIKIVLSCVCLHNFLMSRTQKSLRQMYCSSELLNEENNKQHCNDWPLNNQTHSSPANSAEAHAMRDTIAQYFLSPEDEVDWQYDYINRGRYQDTEKAA